MKLLLSFIFSVVFLFANQQTPTLDELLLQQKKLQLDIAQLQSTKETKQTVLAMNDEPSLDEEGLDEPGLESDDDPMAEEDDPLADDSDDNEDSVAQSSHYPSIKTSNLYRLATGNKKLLRRGFATGNSSEKEDQGTLVNAYAMKSKILYSEDVSFLFRFSVTFLQEHDFLNDRYTDDGEFRINEAYVKADRGSYNYKLGALQVTNGPLDIDSPSNILNMGSTLAIKSFDLDNLNQSFIGGQFSSVGENSTFTVTASALKPETAGTEYTRYLAESEQRNNNSSQAIDDYSELSNNIGMRYQHMFSAVDIGISAYYWFDKDAEMSWTDTSSAIIPAASSFSDTYSERITNVFFSGFDFDANIGKSVLKGEFYYFHNKNNYSYYTNSNNEKVFSTVQSDMFSGAISLEKVWGDFFLMAVYSYKELYDVQAETNVLDYENRADNNTSIRNIHTQQGTLVARYAFSPKTKLIMSYSEAFPIQKVSALIGLEYEISAKHELSFKAVYIDAQEHIATSSKLNSKQMFIDYKYHF